jgi:AcrR family transcriptional regulator
LTRGRFASGPARATPAPGGHPLDAADGRRLQILRAATDVICERGFDDTRIAQIAERAGVSGGTIIYHFQTLDRLLVEALKHAEAAFYSAAEHIVANRDTPKERLRSLVEWVLSPADHNNRQLATLWIDTWSQATRHPEVAATRAAQDERWRSLIASVAASPGIAPRDLERFAVGFGALLDGLMIQVALDDPSVTPETACEVAMSWAEAILSW